MRLAKWVFRVAGVYGIVMLAPAYFLETTFTDSLHPEFYYGFLGVGLAFQALFLMLASDPSRYRPMMIPAILEKVSYGVATFWLFFADRADSSVLLGGCVDWLFVGLFALAYLATAPSQEVQRGLRVRAA
jgi:hypothetical protein